MAIERESKEGSEAEAKKVRERMRYDHPKWRGERKEMCANMRERKRGRGLISILLLHNCPL